MPDYQAQEASLAAFDPNKQTVAYAVYTAGDKDLKLANSKGTANGRMTRAFPQKLSVLYENRNGTWTEIARTPIPACSFCGDMVPGRYDGVDHKNFLILSSPQYRSALICDPCRALDLHRDPAAVDQIKYNKGL